MANGPHLQGIALLNIPYTHGGSNLWGEHLSQKRMKRSGGPFRKGKKLKNTDKELSANSFNSVDLSVAIQGKHNYDYYHIYSYNNIKVYQYRNNDVLFARENQCFYYRYILLLLYREM